MAAKESHNTFPEEGGSMGLGKHTNPQSWASRNIHSTRDKNKFAAQIRQSLKNMANYLQQMANDKGCQVAETVRTGKQQTINLPPPINDMGPETEDLKIVGAKEVKSVVKRWLKLEELLKKGYATIYSQCSEEVHNKLKSSNN